MFKITVIVWVVVLACCGCRSDQDRSAPTTGPAASDTDRKSVKEWLQRVRFRSADNPRLPDTQASHPIDEGWLQEGRSIPGISKDLERLLADRDASVDPALVAYALGWLGDKSSIPALVVALHDKDAWVRMEAAAALGRIGDSSAVDALCQTAVEDVDHNVRANAAVALGSFGGQKVHECLERVLLDSNAFVREMAVRSLKKSPSASGP